MKTHPSKPLQSPTSSLMSTNRRKVTLKLYPGACAAERLTEWVRLHCELYNAALQERIEAYCKAGKSISLYDQQNALPEIKAVRPEFVELGSHALQQTLRRLDLAFQAFFRRVKAGKTPGFPRFKNNRRFSGFAYPDPAGWKLLRHGRRGGTLRLGSGNEAMSIRVRGRHRFGPEAKPNDLTITRKHGEWFASVTLRVPEAACARTRTEHQHRGVDFGLTDWATLDNGETISNPRWMRNELPRLAELQRQRAKKKEGSVRCRRLSRQAARLHERIGNLRREFLHQQTTRLVRTCAVIATVLTIAMGYIMGYRPELLGIVIGCVLVMGVAWCTSWIFAFFGVIARTLQEVLGPQWTPEIEQAWRKCLAEIEGLVAQSAA